VKTGEYFGLPSVMPIVSVCKNANPLLKVFEDKEVEVM